MPAIVGPRGHPPARQYGAPARYAAEGRTRAAPFQVSAGVLCQAPQDLTLGQLFLGSSASVMMLRWGRGPGVAVYTPLSAATPSSGLALEGRYRLRGGSVDGFGAVGQYATLNAGQRGSNYLEAAGYQVLG